MTILEVRRKILKLQAKLDSLEYPVFFSVSRILKDETVKPLIQRTKRKTARKINIVNAACMKVYNQKQKLQNKIQHYLNILKANPYIITRHDLAISKALELKKETQRPIIIEEEINELNDEYNELVKTIVNYKFKINKQETPPRPINNLINPYKKINNKIVDIRKDIKILDIDKLKRTYNEWEQIYHIQIHNKNNYNLMITEYEFCWLLENTLQYTLLLDDVAPQKELRAKLIYTDIIKNATDEERQQLKNKFIITNFIKEQMYNINC